MASKQPDEQAKRVDDAPAEPPAEPKVKPIPAGHCRVYLEADSQRRSFVDPQTHLRVTKAPRDVPEELVGPSTGSGQARVPSWPTDVVIERNGNG